MVAGLAASETANAQDAGSFYLDRAQIAGGPDDPFMTWRPVFSEKARFYGSATLGYSLNPLRLSTLTDDDTAVANGENPFAHQVITYFGGGVQLNKRLAFDLMLPVAWVNGGGDDPRELGVGGGLSQGVAVHDLRIALRALAIETDDKKFRWGAGGAVFAPTGSEPRFGSDGDTGVWLFTNAEHHFDGFMFAWMVGPHFRNQQGPDESKLQVGNEVRYSMGAFVPMRDGKLQLGVELFGSVGFHDVLNTDGDGPDENESALFRPENTPIEWLAQGRWLMGKNKKWYVQAGGGTRLSPGYGAPDFRMLGQIGTHLFLTDVGPDNTPKLRKPIDKVSLEADRDTDGDGFPDDIDQCPTVKEDGKPPFTDDGCPDLDIDDDGILDKVDKCPTVPEDKDGIEDEDGCPEDDADSDGIKDIEDACPTEKGVKNEDPEKNGCPEVKKKKIFVGRNEIQLLEAIQFAYNQATILPVSFPILDEVTALMKDRPTLRLGIYGHTDSQGAPAYNKNLSDRRAAAVLKYIVGKGIDAGRMESEGFGLEKPIADNATEEGRAKNRRVEFKILHQ
jgi:outer membrane protein OmpA-like peptidoglycan-associated protein